jgi:hypothetical protein
MGGAFKPQRRAPRRAHLGEEVDDVRISNTPLARRCAKRTLHAVDLDDREAAALLLLVGRRLVRHRSPGARAANHTHSHTPT